MSEHEHDPSSGQFIDPMFAVMIAAAVAETIVVWAKKDAVFPDIFPLLVVIVGYINLLLSWFGYHKSVKKKPILGSLRFIITVILLPMYLLTIVMFAGDFYRVAVIYSMVFILWSIWECFKYIEYGDYQGFFKFLFKPYNCIVYLATLYVSAARFLSPQLIDFVPSAIISAADYVALGMIAFAIALLRVSKADSKGGNAISRIGREILTLFFGDRSNNK